jgi:endonuclease YncB( thermonuclease family)
VVYKIFKTVFISLLLLLSVGNSCSANSEVYKALKTIDGDTVYIDFNRNGLADADERIRINGIDTFEVKPTVYLDWQVKCFNLTQEEALLQFLISEPHQL